MAIPFTSTLRLTDVTYGAVNADRNEVEVHGLLCLMGVLGRHVEMKVYFNPYSSKALLLRCNCEERDLLGSMWSLAESYVDLAPDDLRAAAQEWMSTPSVEGVACVTRVTAREE